MVQKVLRLIISISEEVQLQKRIMLKNVKCHRCGNLGHIKKFCRVKLSNDNANMVSQIVDEPKWEQCFSTTVLESNIGAYMTSINYEKEWIIDSGCSHHVCGNDSLFSELHQHNGDRTIVTAHNSMHPVIKEWIVKEGNFVLDSVY